VFRIGRYLAAALLTPAVSPACAAGAPQQLFNKTVTMSWTTSSTVTLASGGPTRNVTNANTRTVYISNAGRPFLRMNLASTRGRNARSGDRGPEDSSGRGSVRFEPGKLVGVETFMSGARQYIATFDAGYSSCTLTVVDAKAGSSAIMRRGPDGAMYKVENATTGSQSCSIQSGNAFAGQ
jgi:hypothetical protein